MQILAGFAVVEQDQFVNGDGDDRCADRIGTELECQPQRIASDRGRRKNVAAPERRRHLPEHGVRQKILQQRDDEERGPGQTKDRGQFAQHQPIGGSHRRNHWQVVHYKNLPQPPDSARRQFCHRGMASKLAPARAAPHTPLTLLDEGPRPGQSIVSYYSCKASLPIR